MTKFDRKSFNYHGGYLTYQGKFVARFKHVPSNKPGFLSFLIKHFTVEEYFDAMAAGQSPAPILEAKGYVDAHIKKWLKEGKLKQYNGRSAAEILGTRFEAV